MNVIRFLLFGTVFVGVFGLAHLYLYRRMFRDTSAHEETQRRGRNALITMAALMAAGVAATRFFAVPGEQILGFFAYGWMGFIALAIGIFLVLDGLRWMFGRLRKDQPTDPNRRMMLSRGVAAVATATATTTGASGVALAMADPEEPEIIVPIQHLPVSLAGFRIVQLSDIHFGPTLREEFANHLVERVNALKPDLVALTGDLVDGTVAELGPCVEALAQIKSTHGIYVCTGNHEYYSGVDAWCEAMTSWGMRVLRNESISIQHGSARFDLVGVDDWRGSRLAGGQKYDFAKSNEGRDQSVFSRLLSHQPKAIHDAAAGGIDLVLSGHTHGGQIWPGKYIVQLVQPYVSGLHRHSERTWIYVHSGTGYWGPPVRVGVPSEIAVITLQNATQSEQA